LAALLHGTVVVGVSQTLRRSTEGATYIRQGGHQVGHWPTFLVTYIFAVLLPDLSRLSRHSVQRMPLKMNTSALSCQRILAFLLFSITLQSGHFLFGGRQCYYMSTINCLVREDQLLTTISHCMPTASVHRPFHVYIIGPALSCQWYPMGDARTHNSRMDSRRIFKLGGWVDHVIRHV